MQEALKTMESDDITIFMNGDSAPIVIKSASDESLIQLILPIKTY
jgi:DNA polymerase-3 subunit beta